MKLPGKIFNRLYSFQVFRYLVIGFFTTVISFGTYWLMIYLLVMPPHFANFVSIFLAVIFAYSANKMLVFNSRCANLQELALEMFRFICSRGIAIAIELSGVYLLLDIVSLAPLPAKALTSVVVLLFNYLSFRYFIFQAQNSAKSIETE